MDHHFELIIVGAGPAGYVATIQAVHKSKKLRL